MHGYFHEEATLCSQVTRIAFDADDDVRIMTALMLISIAHHRLSGCGYCISAWTHIYIKLTMFWNYSFLHSLDYSVGGHALITGLTINPDSHDSTVIAHKIIFYFLCSDR